MYYHTSAPLAMGVGGIGGLSYLDLWNVLSWMSWFWIVLAFWAIVAACSAIRRSVPKTMIIITTPDDDPTPDVPTPVDRSWQEYAHL